MGAFSNMDYELQNSEAAVSDAFTEDDAKGAFLEEVVIGATSAADPLSCIVERRIANEAKTIPKQIHFDAAYAGNAFDTVPYRSLCRGYGG